MEKCKDCIWYYKEHCSNGASEFCTEPVNEDDTCVCWKGDD